MESSIIILTNPYKNEFGTSYNLKVLKGKSDLCIKINQNYLLEDEYSTDRGRVLILTDQDKSILTDNLLTIHKAISSYMGLPFNHQGFTYLYKESNFVIVNLSQYQIKNPDVLVQDKPCKLYFDSVFVSNEAQGITIRYGIQPFIPDN